MLESRELIKRALRLVVDRCPRLARSCYWAGTSSIALEELGHRDSFDLDFHTMSALQDVRPILAEMMSAFPTEFTVAQPPDEFGSGFRGILDLGEGQSITVEVLSNYETPSARDLTPSSTSPGLKRVTLGRYLADKLQCVAEARDLVDIMAIMRIRPAMEAAARKALRDQDELLLVERLRSWTDDAIGRDLAGYPDVDPQDAREMRNLLLSWMRS